MNIRKRFVAAVGVFALMLVFSANGPGLKAQGASGPEEIPVNGMVTMVDLGAKKCIPCKLMAPILEELEAAYRGKAAIVFIDVWEHPEESKKFGVRSIPTQIFFDRTGKEVYRHEGFFQKESIVTRLETLGVTK